MLVLAVRVVNNGRRYTIIPPIRNDELEGIGMRISPVKTSFFLLAG